MKLKVTRWSMDELSQRATLYIKDTDDNPAVSVVLAEVNPIAEITCSDNTLTFRTFKEVNTVEILPDIRDGDFLTHPLVIHYESYS